MGSNLLAHIHGNNCLDHNRVSGHLAMFYALAANIIQQQHTSLVSGQEFILACFVLDCNAHAVAVRIGSKQQVGVTLLGILHAQCHCFLDLRVRIWAGREVAIRPLLFFDNSDIRVSHFF